MGFLDSAVEGAYFPLHPYIVRETYWLLKKALNLVIFLRFVAILRSRDIRGSLLASTMQPAEQYFCLPTGSNSILQTGQIMMILRVVLQVYHILRVCQVRVFPATGLPEAVLVNLNVGVV